MPPAPRAPVSPPASGLTWRARVLVVDDDESVHRAMGRLLSRTYDVTCADGAAALARFEQGERFDLVLCDVSMPGISGIDLHRTVGALSADQSARFAFLSGGGFVEPARTFLARPDILVIDKGAPLREILLTIEGQLRKVGPAPAAGR